MMGCQPPHISLEAPKKVNFLEKQQTKELIRQLSSESKRNQRTLLCPKFDQPGKAPGMPRLAQPLKIFAKNSTAEVLPGHPCHELGLTFGNIATATFSIMTYKPGQDGINRPFSRIDAALITICPAIFKVPLLDEVQVTI
jgi:hypothetical protein